VLLEMEAMTIVDEMAVLVEDGGGVSGGS